MTRKRDDASGSEDAHHASRRAAKRGARALRGRPGWDPTAHVRESPQDALQRLDQEARDAAAYADADACSACAKLRAASGDATALCETHMAAAMGF